MLTIEERAEIRAQCEAATSGPWTYDGMHNEIHAYEAKNSAFLIVSELREHPGDKPVEGNPMYNADFDFIAHARQNIPAILDALEAETARADAAETRAKELSAAVTHSAGTMLDARASRDRWKARALWLLDAAKWWRGMSNDFEKLKDRFLEAYKRNKARAEALERFKAYWDALHGQGLEVANWHKNGDLEPFDNFYESAEQERGGTE